jgi:CRP/FNR family transcriptional regulator
VRIRSCQTCGLQQRCLVRELDAGEACQLARALDYRDRVPAGTVLFRQGAPLDGLYVIHAGMAATSRETAAGERRVTDFWGPGSVLGAADLEDGRFATTARALEPLEVCFLARAAYDRLWQAMPRLEFGLLRIASQHLNRKQVLRPMAGRPQRGSDLQRYLAAMATGYASESPTPSPVPWQRRLSLPRAEIAAHLGLAPGDLDRAAAEPPLAGRVRLEGDALVVPDVGALLCPAPCPA